MTFIPGSHSNRLLWNTVLTVALVCSMGACSNSTTEVLYLNLFPIAIDDSDPFEKVDSLQAELESGPDSWDMDLSSDQVEFGPMQNADSGRIQLKGLDIAGDRVAWAFGPSMQLDSKTLKASLFFSTDDVAVAHAGPSLVDPNENLAAAGTPISITTDSARISAIYNAHHLYLQIEVQDEQIVDNADDLWSGDLVVISLDGFRDSQEGSHGIDDLILAIGQEHSVQIWNPLGANVLQSFLAKSDGSGYRVFVGIPLAEFSMNDNPGPDRFFGLGIEIIDEDGAGQTSERWPASWNPNQPEQRNYFVYGAGILALKTRIIDARLIESQSMDFDHGLAPFRESGSQALVRSPSVGLDDVSVYALWDNEALWLAATSDDDLYCAQDRVDGDRDGIQRDDALEVVLAKEDEEPYRALFSLTGDATAYDRIGAGGWTPKDIYFKFELTGDFPDNDCRSGSGYTFMARIPWSDLGYLEQPPALNDVLAFDLIVYDTDRGAARTRSSFSPMGPTEDPRSMSELRLFDY